MGTEERPSWRHDSGTLGLVSFQAFPTELRVSGNRVSPDLGMPNLRKSASPPVS